MKLYLVQHGDALARDVDPERPLSDRGQHEVQAMAGFLSQAGIRARCVQHSGKRRAEQTAAMLAEAVLMAGRPQAVPGIAPNDDVGVFADGIAGWTEDTLVVGHLPFMARLVALLLTGDAESEPAGQPAEPEKRRFTGWWLLPLLLVFGTLLGSALTVAERLDATVVNMRFVKPLDEDVMRQASEEHELLVTIEENAIAGGAGSAVNEWLAANTENGARVDGKRVHAFG